MNKDNTQVEVFSSSSQVNVGSQQKPMEINMLNNEGAFEINIREGQRSNVFVENGNEVSVSLREYSIFNEAPVGTGIGNADTLDGYHAYHFARKAEWAAITGRWNFMNQLGVSTPQPRGEFEVTGSTYLNGDTFINGSFRDEDFSPGFTGYGFGYEAAKCRLSVDFMTVRKQLKVFELLVEQIRASNGSIWVTNGDKIDAVEEHPDFYRCFIEKNEDTIAVHLKEDDIVLVKSWNGNKKNADGSVGGRYYCAVVVNEGRYYFDIGKTLYHGEDKPQRGDEVVRVGNLSDDTRQGSLYLTGSDDGAPYMRVLDGVNAFDPQTGYSFKDKVVAQVGKLDGTVYKGVALEGYGIFSENAYLTGCIKNPNGAWSLNRDGSGHLANNNIHWNKEGVWVFEGLSDNINGHIDASLATFQTDVLDPTLEKFQNQLDHKIEIFFEETENDPAGPDWGEAQLGNMWYDTKALKAYVWEKVVVSEETTTYHWELITDDGIILALKKAAQAQDTADRKRVIFTGQPTVDDEYSPGDLWTNATYGDYKDDLLVCVVGKAKGAAFDIKHWTLATKYTDDSSLDSFKTVFEEYKEDMQSQVDGKIEYVFLANDPSVGKGWGDKEIGNIWHNTSTEQSWRWVAKPDNAYGWQLITDAKVEQAIKDIETTRAVADGKMIVFTSKPGNDVEYNVGDMWVNATFGDYNNDILRCKTHKFKGDAFSIDHWELASKYTDDTMAKGKSSRFIGIDDPSQEWDQEDYKYHVGDEWVKQNDDDQISFIWQRVMVMDWDQMDADEKADTLSNASIDGYVYFWMKNRTTIDGGRITTGIIDAVHIITERLFAKKVEVHNLSVLSGRIGNFKIEKKLIGEDVNGRLILDPDNKRIDIESDGKKGISILHGDITPVLNFPDSDYKWFAQNEPLSTGITRNYGDISQVSASAVYYVGGSGSNVVISNSNSAFFALGGSGKSTRYTADLPISFQIRHDGVTHDGRIDKLNGDLKVIITSVLMGSSGKTYCTESETLNLSLDTDNEGNTLNYSFVERANFEVVGTDSLYWKVTMQVQGDLAYYGFKHKTTFRHSKWLRKSRDIEYGLKLNKSVSFSSSVGVTEIGTNGMQVHWAADRYFRVCASDGDTFITSKGKWVHNGYEVATANDVNQVTADLANFVRTTDLQASYYNKSTSDSRYTPKGGASDQDFKARNLQLYGEIDHINAQTTIIEDALLKLNNGNNLVDSGLTIFDGTDNKARLFFRASDKRWVMGDDDEYHKIASENWVGSHYLRKDINQTMQGKLWLNGQIVDSSARLQVNGFMRTGNIFLHTGGNTPNADRTNDTIGNNNGSLEWRSNTVWTALNSNKNTIAWAAQKLTMPNSLILGESSRALSVHNSNGYLHIGAKNDAWCHFYTDRPAFYFDRAIHVKGAFSSYSGDVYLQRAGTTLIHGKSGRVDVKGVLYSKGSYGESVVRNDVDIRRGRRSYIRLNITGSGMNSRYYKVFSFTGKYSYHSFSIKLHITGRTENRRNIDYYATIGAETNNSEGRIGNVYCNQYGVYRRGSFFCVKSEKDLTIYFKADSDWCNMFASVVTCHSPSEINWIEANEHTTSKPAGAVEFDDNIQSYQDAKFTEKVSAKDINVYDGSGRGLRFWNSDSYKIYMSRSAVSGWGGRISEREADKPNDYNMYFRMSDKWRGFVFGNNQDAAQTHIINGNIYTKGYYEGAKGFMGGFGGHGTRIDVSKDSIATQDLTVRGRLRVAELEVTKITGLNGSFAVTNSCVIDSVETISAPERKYKVSIDKGKKYGDTYKNRVSFRKDDFIYSKVVSGSGAKYWVGKVLSAGLYDFTVQLFASPVLFYDSTNYNFPINANYDTGHKYDLRGISGNVYLKIQAKDAEGGLRVAMRTNNQDEQIIGTLSGKDNETKWYYVPVLLTGNDEISIYSSNPDGGTIYDFIVITRHDVDIPAPGDAVHHRGSSSDNDRQGYMYMTSCDEGAPYMAVYDGINSHKVNASNLKVLMGKLDGKNIAGIGNMSGYGLAADNVYLKGKIIAKSGELGSFYLDDKVISSNNNTIQMRHDTNRFVVYKNASNSSAYRGGNQARVMMFYNSPGDWGLFGHNGTKDIFRLGSSNRITVFAFDNNRLYHTVNGNTVWMGRDKTGEGYYGFGIHRNNDNWIRLIAANNLAYFQIKNNKNTIVDLRSVGTSRIACLNIDPSRFYVTKAGWRVSVGQGTYNSSIYGLEIGKDSKNRFSFYVSKDGNGGGLYIRRDDISRIHLSFDGAGYVASQKIKWNADGSGNICNKIKWNAAGAITLDPSVKIGWGSVTGTEGVTNKLTKIDANGIYTGALKASQIEAVRFKLTKGEVGGFYINSNKIYNDYLDINSSNNKGVISFIQPKDSSLFDTGLRFIQKKETGDVEIAQIRGYSSGGYDALRFFVGSKQAMFLSDKMCRIDNFITQLTGDLHVAIGLKVSLSSSFDKTTFRDEVSFGNNSSLNSLPLKEFIIGRQNANSGSFNVDCKRFSTVNAFPSDNDITLKFENQKSGQIMTIINRCNKQGRNIYVEGVVGGTYHLYTGECIIMQYNSYATYPESGKGKWFIIGYHRNSW